MRSISKKRRIGLNLVFIDVAKHGQIKDSLGYLIENNINPYADDVREMVKFGELHFHSQKKRECQERKLISSPEV